MGLLRKQFRFQTLLVMILMISIAVGAGWKGKLYQEGDHSGHYLRIQGETTSTCVNISSFYNFCEDEDSSASNCQSASRVANSIDTEGTCVRVYPSENCEGTPLMELRPGTLCHYWWSNCNIKGRMGSIGGCPSTNNDDFDHRTPKISPAGGSLRNGNVSSPNYPASYNSNANANWIITVPHGKKVKINFIELDIEEGENCTYDKVTISELVTQKVIYEGCGKTLPDIINSESNQVRVNFKSDGSINNKGFSLHWESCENCQQTNNSWHIVRPRDVPIPKSTAATAASQDTPIQIETIDMSKFKVYDSSVPTADIPNIEFITFRKGEPDKAVDGRNIAFPVARHMFYIHGYATSDLADGLEIKDAIFRGADDVSTVTLVDWRKWSLPTPDSSPSWPPNYKIVALNNLPKVADVLKDFLRRKMQINSNVYLVGFSLGAHIAGTTFRRLNAQTGFVYDRITALDPAGPIFEYSLYGLYPVNTTNTLRKSDAVFVDVVHGSTVLGMNNEAGHLDIYMHEVECPSTSASCTHHKTVELYIASLLSCSLITCPTRLSKRAGWFTKTYICDTKDYSQISSLGYLADKYEGRGRHELYLLYEKWSGGFVSTGNCSNFLNLPFSARRRICRSSSTDTERCAGKPYLYKCKLDCPLNEQYATCTYKDLSLSSTVQQVEQIEQDEGVNWGGSSSNCLLTEACRSEGSGDHVPYYILYKKPDSARFAVINGRDDIFDSNIVAGSQNSFLAQTLSPVYRESGSVNYLMWNDDNGDRSTSQDYDEDEVEPLASTGHSKGVLAFNSKTGFLLLHTIPKFPYKRDQKYGYPSNGFGNAQIAICVSLRSNDETEFANHLLQILTEMLSFKPDVYDSRVAPNVDQRVKDAVALLVSKPRLGKPGTPIRKNIELLTPQTFQFSIHTSGRTTSRDEDMFAYLAGTYRTGLLAQTWPDRFENNRLPSKCDGDYHVENVERLTVNGDVWLRSKDHSKWGISANQNTPLTCIGDLNRAKSTMARGGMFICTRNAYVYNIFRNFPREIESCQARMVANISETTTATTMSPSSIQTENVTEVPIRTIAKLYSVDLYDLTNFEGSRTSLALTRGGCFNVQPPDTTSSINTRNNCIVAYRFTNCEESESHRSEIIGPGTHSHNDLSNIGMGNNIRSVKICDPDAVDFFDLPNFLGRKTTVQLFNRECQNVHPFNTASSIYTHDKCIIAYQLGGCKVNDLFPSKRIAPGTPSHNDLREIEFDNKIRSIQLCP